MSDMGEHFNEHKQLTKELKAKHGIDCPGCKEKFPRAIPSKLLPGWKCRTCGYIDPRKGTPINMETAIKANEIIQAIISLLSKDQTNQQVQRALESKRKELSDLVNSV